MSKKPVRLKTYRTWCVVRPDGRPEYAPEKADTSKAQILRFMLFSDSRIARVEIREVAK